jgi:ribonuclease BN (tRNA processing enzyme)
MPSRRYLLMEIALIGTGSILTRRMSASALIDDKVLVDTPNGCMKALRRMGRDPARIDVCLITHFHADHFFDIVFLFLENGLRTRRERDLHLVGPEGLEARVEKLFGLSYPESWERVKSNASPRFVELGSEGGSLVVDGYSIEAVPVEHTVPLAFGYAVAGPDGGRVGFTGDTVYCAGVEKLAGECSALVVDTAFLTGRSGHMGLDDVERLASRCPEVQFVATHLSDDVNASTCTNLTIPQDGYIFTADK